MTRYDLDSTSDADDRLRARIIAAAGWTSDTERDNEVARIDSETPDLVTDADRWQFTRRLVVEVCKQVLSPAILMIANGRQSFINVANQMAANPTLNLLRIATAGSVDENPRVHRTIKSTFAAWQYGLIAKERYFGDPGDPGADPPRPPVAANPALARKVAARAVDRLCDGFENETPAVLKLYVTAAKTAYQSMGDP